MKSSCFDPEGDLQGNEREMGEAGSGYGPGLGPIPAGYEMNLQGLPVMSQRFYLSREAPPRVQLLVSEPLNLPYLFSQQYNCWLNIILT